MYMPTLPCYPGVSRIRHQSPGLLYGSPRLLDKIIFRVFLCLSLRFSPFLAQNLNFPYSQYGFWGIFAPIQSLIMTKIISGIKMISPILIVCTSCKTSYNVLSHAHIYQGWGGVVGLIKFPERGGGGSGKERGPRFKFPTGWRLCQNRRPSCTNFYQLCFVSDQGLL